MPTISKPIIVKPLDVGSIIAGSADTGHPVSNLNRHEAIGLTWKATNAAAIWARGTFDTAQSVDFLAIIGANAQNGVTKFRLRLGNSQADVDGGSAPYDSGALNFVSTTPQVAPDDGLYHSFLRLGAPVSALWWRIDITGHVGTFEAADVVMGKAIEPSHYYNYDFEQSVQDLGQLQIGRFGVADAQPGAVWRTIDFSLAWQGEAEFEASFRPLMKSLGTSSPVYVCFDPTDSAYRQARTYMGFLRKPLFAKGVRKPRTYQQDFSLLSFI